MALNNPAKGISQLADASGKPIIGNQQSTIAELTDSTTASVKDDIASLAAKINAILQVLAAHGLISDS